MVNLATMIVNPLYLALRLLYTKAFCKKRMDLCVDYRRLNSVTRSDAYLMPRSNDLIDWLGEAKYITALDHKRGGWGTGRRAKDHHKTAFLPHLDYSSTR